MGRPTVTKETFWNRVKKAGPEECWNWTGPVSHSKNGGLAYGRIDAFGVIGVYVHRVAYWLTHQGKIELPRGDGLLVRHKCDNTLCCNPTHLEVGTHADNMRDKVDRGRSKWFECSLDSPRSKFSREQVLEIRKVLSYGISSSDVANLFSVHKSTIQAIKQRRHYADV